MSLRGEKMAGACINLGNGEARTPVRNNRYDFSE
jgi:hypothetical protein